MRSDYRLEADEVARVMRVRVAEKLGKFPHEIDLMPYADYCDAVAVWTADKEIEERRAHIRRGMKGGR